MLSEQKKKKKKLVFICNVILALAQKELHIKPMHNTAVRQPQKTNIKIIVCTVFMSVYRQSVLLLVLFHFSDSDEGKIT